MTPEATETGVPAMTLPFAETQRFYNAGYAAGRRAALQEVVDLSTVVPDHPHGGVHPPYIEWKKVAALLAAALEGEDRG